MLTLHHFHILMMIDVPAAMAGGFFGDLPTFTPEIALADVMIVRDSDARAVAKISPEGKAELQPGGGVSGRLPRNSPRATVISDLRKC